MATTPNFGWTLPTVGGDSDTWGTVLNTLLDAVDAQVKANQVQAGYAAPTGAIIAFNGSTAPNGWIIQNGGTIGNASSNATTRANADTAALFALYWGTYSNTDAPVYDSAGNVSSRGASAAADYAANKAIKILDSRGRFIRGLDLSAGVDSGRSLGSVQADLVKDHSHNLHGYSYAGGSITTSVWSNGTRTDSSNTTSTMTSGGGSETRPVNIAFCIIEKL